MEFHFNASLYESSVATTPLYDGASITLLQALCRYFDWFSSHGGVSKEALSELLYTHHHFILPYGNRLPDSYEGALRILKPYLMETITFHVCPNDCVVFRNDYADNVTCPVCNSCRYKPNSIVPQRRFVYMPIGPRLERLYGTKNNIISELLQSYTNISSDKMNDIQDSPCWKALFGVDGPFGGDKRGLALSLCVDGVNPFSVQTLCGL